MAWKARAGALVLLVTVLAVANAAAGAQGPEVQILDDVGEDGTTHAGVVNTLGWVLANGDGEPAFHQDAVFEVTFEGRTLLKTSASSGHDYDGIDPYHVRFPGVGNYSVHVTTWEDEEEHTATATGQVLPAPEGQLAIEADVPESVTAGEATSFAYEVLGPDGTPAEHADVQVHVRRAEDAFEILRTTTHAHGGQHAFDYTFDRTGTFEVVLVATPIGAKGTPAGQATSRSFTIEVAEPETPELRDPTPPAEQPLTNSREADEGEDYRLFGTYDPYTTVGPHGRITLGGVVLDADTGKVVRGVDYAATLTGPEGRTLFDSSSLHSADGVLQIATSRPEVGEYALELTADTGDWTGEVTLTFGVIPPADARETGALMASLNTTEDPTEGEATTFPIHVTDPADAPAMHSEVDFRVLDPDAVPFYAGKLHTHTNATFPLTVTPSQAGAHTFEVLPHSLQPTPTPYTWGEEIGQAPVYDVDVAAGSPLANRTSADAGATEVPDEAPAPGLAAVLAAVLGLALARRRGA